MGRRIIEASGRALLAAAALVAANPALADRGGPGIRQIHGPGARHVQPSFDGPRHVHGRTRIGIGIQLGPGFFYPSYPYSYPYPSYGAGYVYGPALTVVPASPPQYIERGDETQGEAGAPAPAQPHYWYRCAEPEGYYPYVAACPGGWQTVPAQPPAMAR